MHGDTRVPDISGTYRRSRPEVQLEVSRVSLFVPAEPNEFLKTRREGGCSARATRVNYRGQFVSADKSV